MDDTRERLIELEALVKHGHDFTAYRLEALEHQNKELLAQLIALQQRPDPITRIMGPGAWAKLILAVLIPLVVLLATGDLGAALKAARSSPG
jgi:hypothetical protein